VVTAVLRGLLESGDRASAKVRAAFVNWLNGEVEGLSRGGPPADN